MQMNEELIRNVIQEVLAQIGGNGAVSKTVAPANGLGVYPSADAAVEAAQAAFQKFRTRPIGDRAKAVAIIKKICVEQADELGKAELDETQIGRLDHKVAKLRDAIPSVPGTEYLSTNAVKGDGGLTLDDHAPFGVIGAITPVTHSLPTLACNAISMLSAGNTVVFNAHPSGSKIAARGVRLFNQAFQDAIGLNDLLTIIDPPTLESAEALFKHQGVKMLVVTGGPSVARAALASRRRAVVAGPGNPPVVVDATACLENAAKSIVQGAAFDNNLLCIGEKQVFAVAAIFDKLLELVGRHGGRRLNPAQIEALTAAAFSFDDKGRPHLKKELIGKDPEVLARAAGVSAPSDTQILYGETDANHPFVSIEQMMPFVPFIRVPDVERAIVLARESEHGFGHTAMLHSRDTTVMEKMGRAMDCTIFGINGPSTAALSGQGVTSFSIAGPTGEGITTPLTFSRKRRTAVIGGLRFQ